MFRADTLGFLSLPGTPPEADQEIALDLVHLTSAPPWITTLSEILLTHRQFRESVETQAKFAHFCTASQLRLHLEPQFQGMIGVVYGLQMPPEDIDLTTADDVELMVREGIRITTLAYNKRSRYAGGCEEPEVGLTNDGRKFIDLCNEAGLIIDLSHASHATARDALRHSKKPVIASHVGCYHSYPHPRNLPDDVLEGIAAQGGIVGIYNLTFGLHPERNDLAPFFGHLLRAVVVCGQDAVALGSDGVYKSYDKTELVKHHELMVKNLKPEEAYGVRFPSEPSELTCPERIKILKKKFEHLPLSATAVEKIIGINFFKFLSRNLP